MPLDWPRDKLWYRSAMEYHLTTGRAVKAVTCRSIDDQLGGASDKSTHTMTPFVPVSVTLRTKPRAMHVLGKCSFPEDRERRDLCKRKEQTAELGFRLERRYSVAFSQQIHVIRKRNTNSWRTFCLAFSKFRVRSFYFTFDRSGSSILKDSGHAHSCAHHHPAPHQDSVMRHWSPP